MEIIQKYDDEKIYTILTAWLQNGLLETLDEQVGIEEIDIINIVAEDITKSTIEGSCKILMYGEDEEAEYETDFFILFNEENMVIDVQFALEGSVES